MKKKISFIILCGIILLGVCGCGNNSDNTNNSQNANEEIVLGKYEEMIYDYIIDNDFYNPSEVRVISGNSLYGFKLSAFNKVGGNISKCYDFQHKSEYDIRIVESECGEYAHSSDVEDYEISIKDINNSLKKHWEDIGY